MQRGKVDATVVYAVNLVLLKFPKRVRWYLTYTSYALLRLLPFFASKMLIDQDETDDTSGKSIVFLNIAFLTNCLRATEYRDCHYVQIHMLHNTTLSLLQLLSLLSLRRDKVHVFGCSQYSQPKTAFYSCDTSKQ